MQFLPIFIAGCDRSGTTMLGDMMGSSQNGFAAPESQWIHEYLLQWQAGTFATNLEAARWLNSHFRFAVWDMGLKDSHLATLIRRDDPRKTIENILACYLMQQGHNPDSLVTWCDHTPDNFKHYPLLKSIFPEAKYIHIVRDGRAVYQSVKALDWGPSNAYMATRFWVERVQQGLTVELAEGASCTRVRYEDLVAQPEQVLSRLCRFAGINYDPCMVNGGGLVLPGFTRNQHSLVGQRPDASRLFCWREKLNRREIRVFEAYPWARTLLDRFDYSLQNAEPASVSNLSTLAYYLHDFGTYMIHRLRHRSMERHTLRQQARPPVCANASGDSASVPALSELQVGKLTV